MDTLCAPTRVLTLAVIVLVAGCSKVSNSDTADGETDGSTAHDIGVVNRDATLADNGMNGTDDASATDGTAILDAASNDAAPVDGGMNPNRIAGTGPDGMAFANIASAIWIGQPSNPHTVVVYVASGALACGDMQQVGWNTVVAAGNQILELKAYGLSTGSFAVTNSPTPFPGEAAVAYVVTSTNPHETKAAGGTFTLSHVNAATDITGSFSLTFSPSGALSGSFDAAFCANGVEP